MLFSNDSPDAAALGSWIQILFWVLGSLAAIIVGVAALWSMFRKKAPEPDSELVTRGELDRTIIRIDMDIKELRTYTQDRTHDLANKLHAMSIRIVYMITLISQLCHKEGIVIPPLPDISIQDE